MSRHIPSDHEVETFNGRFVDVSNPSPDTITLDDIAHALSNTCRYGGHCERFYSVAEHAVFVSKRLERKGYSKLVQLAGLHHDDAEAYLGDIPRPLKPLLGEPYRQMTTEMDEAIVQALVWQHGVHAANFHAPQVKEADNWALFVEARHLLPSEGRQWFSGGQGSDQWELGGLPSRIVIPDYWLGGISPDAAQRLFIQRHWELTE